MARGQGLMSLPPRDALLAFPLFCTHLRSAPAYPCPGRNSVNLLVEGQ